ncbi:MAG TPA: hypothetical protein VNK92_05190, partial [Vicinamibacterales bacterium]|nr:hypothetical protein [Vicinamibacterales bacterium]
YARAFARPPDPMAPLSGSGVLVVTSRAGLVPASAPLTPARLRALGRARIDPAHRRYRAPLERSARIVAEEIGERTEVVLLGSVATEKYTAVLSAVFGERLVVPAALVGRGALSRGALLLAAAAAGQELWYVPIVSGSGPQIARRASAAGVRRRGAADAASPHSATSSATGQSSNTSPKNSHSLVRLRTMRGSRPVSSSR